MYARIMMELTRNELHDLLLQLRRRCWYNSLEWDRIIFMSLEQRHDLIMHMLHATDLLEEASLSSLERRDLAVDDVCPDCRCHEVNLYTDQPYPLS